MSDAGYTFVSVSTAKPGQLDELIIETFDMYDLEPVSGRLG